MPLDGGNRANMEKKNCNCKEDPVCYFYYKWICYIFTNSSLYVISRRKINDWEWK